MKPTNFEDRKISNSIVEEITGALKSIRSYGSVEIYIQKGVVTQITVRNIKKTNSRIK